MRQSEARHVSIYAWAGLTTALALALTLAPGALARIAGVPLTDAAAPWARLAGLMAAGYSLAYWIAAVYRLLPWMWASVVLRGTVLVPVGALVAFGMLPPSAIVIGVVDLCGALWTWRELGAPRRRVVDPQFQESR